MPTQTVLSTSVVTTDHPRGQKFVETCRAQYNKARLGEDAAQQLNESSGFAADIAEAIRKHSRTKTEWYANQVVRSSMTYPPEYQGPGMIVDQINKLSQITGIDPSHALEFAGRLPPLHRLAEGFFAVASDEGLAAVHFSGIDDPDERRCRSVQFMLDQIKSSRLLYNYCDGQITPDRYRIYPDTAAALNLIAEQQKGGIWIIPAQLGMLHRGESVNRAREIFKLDEFGFGGLEVLSISSTHPERLVRWEQLHMDCSGDQFAPGADGVFSLAPLFYFDDDRVRFGTGGVDDAGDRYGSVSGFLPQ